MFGRTPSGGGGQCLSLGGPSLAAGLAAVSSSCTAILGTVGVVLRREGGREGMGEGKGGGGEEEGEWGGR